MIYHTPCIIWINELNNEFKTSPKFSQVIQLSTLMKLEAPHHYTHSHHLPRQINPGALSTTQTRASLAHEGLVAVRQLLEVLDEGASCSHPAVPLLVVRLTEQDVVPHRASEKPGLLRGVRYRALEKDLTARRTQLA